MTAPVWDGAPAPVPLSFDDQARCLHDALTSSGEEGPYVFVASSLGGLIARAYAREFPSDLAAMVLVDAAEEEHIFQRLDVLGAAVRKQLFVTRLLAVSGLMPAAVRGSLPSRLPTDVRSQLNATLSRWSHWRSAANEVAAYSLTPAERRVARGFGQIDVPLTVIAHGRPFRGPNAPLDTGWRAGQERLATLSAQTRFVVAQDSGHSIAQEDSGLVASEVVNIVRQVRARP